LFACTVFRVGLAVFSSVVMPSLVFRAMLGGVSGTVDGSVLFGGLGMLGGTVVSFFFGAIGTSVGVLYFLGGVLTVMEPLLNAVSPFFSFSLHIFVLVSQYPSTDSCRTRIPGLAVPTFITGKG